MIALAYPDDTTDETWEEKAATGDVDALSTDVEKKRDESKRP